ncbi:MAG: T9SS type A sorting domain-containing protein [Fibrobacterota bacterium]
MTAIKTFLIFCMATLVVVPSRATETLLCGFEQDEMAAWPLSVMAGKGDTNEIAYQGGVEVSFLTRHVPAEATQGEWALCHEMFSSNPPANELVRFRASMFQDWSYLSPNRLLDTTRTSFYEFNGPVDYNVQYFCTLFRLFRVMDRLPAEKQDWTGYDYLYVDVRTTRAQVFVWVGFEGKYRPSNTVEFEVDTGSFHTLRIPLKDMAWVGDEDMTDVKNLMIMMRDVKGPTTIFMDNIRLVTKEVAPVLPVLNPRERVLVPRLLTTYFKPPATPPPAPVTLTRSTGPITQTPPLLVTDKSNNNYRVGNLSHGIVSYDNTHYAVIDRLNNYRYWASPPEPNSNPGGSHCCPGWIASVDAGQTWKSDAVANSYSLQFSTVWENGGTVQATAESDNLLRGYGYFIPMGWCSDYAPGSAFQQYNYFFRLQPGPDRWEVYPHFTYPQAPAYPNNIIVSDIPRGCMGGIRFTTLPSGRMWCSMMSNHLNPLKGNWSLYASYSDDGGMRWQYPQKKISAIFEPGQAEPVVVDNGNPAYLVPYQGKVLCFIYNPTTLYYTVGDGQSWTTLKSIGNPGYDKNITSAVSYKDSAVFAALIGGAFIKLSNGSATSETVGGATTRPFLTLVGERLWYLWRSADSVYCKKYFIHQNRWTAPTLVLKTDSPIVDLKVATVSPPSHVPLVWRENAPGGGYNIKMTRIPIDAEEAALDPDYDGLENSSETTAGTDSNNPDSDGDGLWDGQEVVLLTTDPKKADTDDDGDNDAVELYAFSNPRDAFKTATQNQPPVVSLVVDSTGDTLRLDAGNTTDAESDYLRYFWDITLNTGEVIKAEGARIVGKDIRGVSLTVEDGHGNQSAIIYGDPDLAVAKNTRIFSATLSAQPNPFIDGITLKYALPEKANVLLDIYDVNGRRVQRLVNDEKASGCWQLVWKPQRHLASGIYYVKFHAGKHDQTKRLVYLK